LSDMIDGADEMAIQTMEFAMPPSDLAWRGCMCILGYSFLLFMWRLPALLILSWFFYHVCLSLYQQDSGTIFSGAWFKTK
jgi:hypothetical protein